MEARSVKRLGRGSEMFVEVGLSNYRRGWMYVCMEAGREEQRRSIM